MPSSSPRGESAPGASNPPSSSHLESSKLVKKQLTADFTEAMEVDEDEAEKFFR